jgi:hypothetical protein
MLKDKMGQEIKVGMFIIKPWDGCFDIGRVIKVTEKTFTYEYMYVNYKKEKQRMESVCKVPDRCLAVPEILANYWSILDGV